MRKYSLNNKITRKSLYNLSFYFCMRLNTSASNLVLGQSYTDIYNKTPTILDTVFVADFSYAVCV